MIDKHALRSARGLLGVVVAAAAVLLTGPTAHATERYRFIEQPADGYEAIRFNRRTTLENVLVRNDLTFEAGTTLIFDRELDGVPLFCGAGAMNDGWLMTYCLSVDGERFTLSGYPNAASVIPSDAYSRLRVLLN